MRVVVMVVIMSVGRGGQGCRYAAKKWHASSRTSVSQSGKKGPYSYFIIIIFFSKKEVNFVRSEISLGWTANHECRDMENLGSYRAR